MSENQTNPIETIPSENIMDIIKDLEYQSLYNVSLSCSYLNDLSNTALRELIKTNAEIRKRYIRYNIKNKIKPRVNSVVDNYITNVLNGKIIEYEYKETEFCLHCSKYKKSLFCCPYCDANSCCEDGCGKTVSGSKYCVEHYADNFEN